MLTPIPAVYTVSLSTACLLGKACGRRWPFYPGVCHVSWPKHQARISRQGGSREAKRGNKESPKAGLQECGVIRDTLDHCSCHSCEQRHPPESNATSRNLASVTHTGLRLPSCCDGSRLQSVRTLAAAAAPGKALAGQPAHAPRFRHGLLRRMYISQGTDAHPRLRPTLLSRATGAAHW